MSLASSCARGVCVCLLPRIDNDHRPYALRHGSLSFISALLLTIKIATVVVVGFTPSEAQLSTITTNRIIQLTNQERVKAGLNELSTNSALTKAAQLKSEDMLNHQYFAHISPSGVTPWFWMAKTGYTYQIAGENLAIDFNEAEDVVQAWLNSPSHRDNMLRPDYAETGVAVATGQFEGGISTIVVHMFGKPVAIQPITAQVTSVPTATQTPAVKGEVSSPLPTASATPPTPTPTETTTPTPLPAPHTPRISSQDGTNTVTESIFLTVSGDANSTAHILLNNQLYGNVNLPASGTANYTLNVTALGDGQLTIRAYATSQNSSASALSDPLVITKNTSIPANEPANIIALLSPVTDRATLAIRATKPEETKITVTQNSVALPATTNQWFVSQPSGTITVKNSTGRILANLDPAPQFTKATPSSGNVPAVFSHLANRFIASTLVTLLILLILTIFIRIRIQHPALITHATFVILLAASLLTL